MVNPYNFMGFLVFHDEVSHLECFAALGSKNDSFLHHWNVELWPNMMMLGICKIFRTRLLHQFFCKLFYMNVSEVTPGDRVAYQATVTVIAYQAWSKSLLDK